MVNSPGGKSAGRVSIRVLPDTSDFRRELLNKLKVIQERTKLEVTVTVNKVRVDNVKVKADLERQFARLGQKLNVRAIVDTVAVRKVAVRKSLQKQFDDLGLVVKVGVDLSKAKRDVEKFVHNVNGKDANIDVGVNTLLASRRLAFVARTRIVDLVVNVNKAAFTKALVQLSALSGARKSFEWIRDLADWLGDLDKKLPSLALISTGILNLASVLLGSVQGLVGFGAGVSAIVPTFLALPGMILGSIVAIVAFGVALADSKKQLAPLADEMHTIRDLIRENFWAEARQPILDLVNNIFPQLTQAFGVVSSALGRFTGNLAASFEKALAGGKLVELFKGISKSFDVLSTGTDAFAGAIVSLSAIAAKYAPRLAQWFVDIANQFDDWLIQVSNDGRLDQWMENGIQALKDLGHLIVGIARIFNALWTAAEAAGGTALAGLAKTFNDIATVMEGPRFQGALTKVFVGANAALDALASGIKQLGGGLEFQADTIATVLERAGQVFDVLLSGIGAGLKNQLVSDNLTAGFNSLLAGFQGFSQYLPTIVLGFSQIVKFAGDLARAFGPVLGATLAAFVPIMTAVMDVLLPFVKLLSGSLLDGINAFADGFSGALTKAGDLGGVIVNIASALRDGLVTAAPGLLAAAQDFLLSIVKAVPAVMPIIVDALTTVGPQIIDALQTVLSAVGFALPSVLQGIVDVIVGLAPSLVKNLLLLVQNLAIALIQMLPILIIGVIKLIEGLAQGFADAWPLLVANAKKMWPIVIQGIVDAVPQVLNAIIGMRQSILDTITTLLPSFIAGYQEIIPIILQAFTDAIPQLVQAGSDFVTAFIEGQSAALPAIVQAFSDAIPLILDTLAVAIPLLIDAGVQFFSAMVDANGKALPRIIAAFTTALPKIIDTLSVAIPKMIDAAIYLFLAIVDGLSRAQPQIMSAIQRVMPLLIAAIVKSIPLFVQAGAQIIQGIIRGVANMQAAFIRALVSMASAGLNSVLHTLGINSPSKVFRVQVGQMIPAGIMSGLEDGKAQLNAALTHLVTVPTVPTMPSLAPSLSGVGSSSSSSSTFNANFSLAPDPGLPLAEQVFQAAQRLKARTAR